MIAPKRGLRDHADDRRPWQAVSRGGRVPPVRQAATARPSVVNTVIAETTRLENSMSEW